MRSYMTEEKYMYPIQSKPSTPVPFGNPFSIGFDDENEKGILLHRDEFEPPLFLEAYSEYSKDLVITQYDHGLLVERSWTKNFYDLKGHTLASVRGDESIEVHDRFLVLRRKDKTEIYDIDRKRHTEVKEIIEDEENPIYMI